MRVAVVTVAHGRHDHLLRQRQGVAAGSRQPEIAVLVAVDDDAMPSAPCTDLVHLPSEGRLPIARARNVGAARAIALGADLLVFLDVDVIPGPDLLARYVDAVEREPTALLSGPVAYLPPGRHALADLGGHPPHAARPSPPPGALLRAERPELFWSLSFALTVDTWTRVGGFDEAYRGYGAEDTDFGLRAAARGIPLIWVGGAHGYHQHHPVSSPPVEHLDDILRNGHIFRRTWGYWPMGGWLTAFAELGLIREADGDWTRIRPAAVGPDRQR